MHFKISSIDIFGGLIDSLDPNSYQMHLTGLGNWVKEGERVRGGRINKINLLDFRNFQSFLEN